jgi:NAD(P)-dependent dehydrogenase (short-subunit alcohol dehydrogenase family)
LKPKKIFLLFGASGRLGLFASEYFIKHDYDEYYFFSRKPLCALDSEKKFRCIETKDLTREENVIEAFKNVMVDTQAIYCLLNVIGSYNGGNDISNTNYEVWKKLFDVNLNVAFLLAKHFGKLISKTLGGSICFISARSSFEIEGKRAGYNISKNSLNLLVQSLAEEGKEINLTSHAVAPFVIESQDVYQWITDKRLIITPEEICSTINEMFVHPQDYNGQIIKLPINLL